MDYLVFTEFSRKNDFVSAVFIKQFITLDDVRVVAQSQLWLSEQQPA